MTRRFLTLTLALCGAEASASCAPQYQWRDDVIRAANTHRIEPALMLAVITQESQWCPTAVSSAGARGLGQLMPGTAQDMGVKDPFHPVQNAYGSARYLRLMLDQFGRVDVALAAYNAGPGTVRKAGGIPDIEETRTHVQKVLAYYAALKPAMAVPRPPLTPPAPTPIYASPRNAPAPAAPVAAATPTSKAAPQVTPATTRPTPPPSAAVPAPVPQATVTLPPPTPEHTVTETLVIRQRQPSTGPSTTVIRARN